MSSSARRCTLVSEQCTSETSRTRRSRSLARRSKNDGITWHEAEAVNDERALDNPQKRYSQECGGQGWVWECSPLASYFWQGWHDVREEGKVISSGQNKENKIFSFFVKRIASSPCHAVTTGERDRCLVAPARRSSSAASVPACSGSICLAGVTANGRLWQKMTCTGARCFQLGNRGAG